MFVSADAETRCADAAGVGVPSSRPLPQAVNSADVRLEAVAQAPKVEKKFDATLCWLSETPLGQEPQIPGQAHHAHGEVPVLAPRLPRGREHAGAARRRQAEHERHRARGIKVQQPLVFDSYETDRATGSFIVIDEATNNTVAAGMIV